MTLPELIAAIKVKPVTDDDIEALKQRMAESERRFDERQREAQRAFGRFLYGSKNV